MEEENDDSTYTRRITFRLSEPEWETLCKLLKKSRHGSMSELIRAMLFWGKIRIVTHDDSISPIMEQLSAIRTELHRIGVNINQITGRFHWETLPEARLLQALEVLQLHQTVGQKVDELFTVIEKISYRWLPE